MKTKIDFLFFLCEFLYSEEPENRRRVCALNSVSLFGSSIISYFFVFLSYCCSRVHHFIAKKIVAVGPWLQSSVSVSLTSNRIENMFSITHEYRPTLYRTLWKSKLCRMIVLYTWWDVALRRLEKIFSYQFVDYPSISHFFLSENVWCANFYRSAVSSQKPERLCRPA